MYIQGKITQEVYDIKNTAIDIEQEELAQQLTKCQLQANDTKDIAEMIVELAGNGLKIFESSKPAEKNQLLKILVSNCVLDNKKARISLQKPFDLLLKTPSCPMWSE